MNGLLAGALVGWGWTRVAMASHTALPTGLVAITPACATVDTWSSLLVGFVASFVVRIVSHWVDKAGFVPAGCCSVGIASP